MISRPSPESAQVFAVVVVQLLVIEAAAELMVTPLVPTPKSGIPIRAYGALTMVQLVVVVLVLTGL